MNANDSNTALVDTTRTGGDYQAVLNLNATPDAVFDALITPADLSQWWTKATGSGTADGELDFWFGDMRVNCHVDEAARPTRVRWSVHLCEPIPDWVGTTIGFDLSPTENGGTRLDFRHQGLTSQLECFDTCQLGWFEALGGLVNFLEKGY